MRLIARTGIAPPVRVVDVGGGVSRLADRLLDLGFRPTVLDISACALHHAQARLGARAGAVEWIAADMISWSPPKGAFALWHDRAALHFLTEASDQAAYAATLRRAVRRGVVIGGFAPKGPLRCSGLDVVRHDGASLGALLGPGFQLLEVHAERHVTPAKTQQAFRYHVFAAED